MNRRQVVTDSVKKLLSLGVSDSEIIDSLRDVGIPEKDAREIISEVKASPASQEELSEAIADSLSVPRELQEPSSGQQASQKQGKKQVQERQQNQNIEKLWEKGILAAADSKLEEMKDLRDSMNSAVAAAVQKETLKEILKMKTVFESQRALMIEKINSSLDAKAREVEDAIASHTKNLGRMNELSMENTSKLEALRKTNESLLLKIDDKLKELEKTKSRLISEMNSDLISSKSSIEEFISEAERKRSEIDARINRTLELESKITEGLLKDAEQKIDNLSMQKSDELEAEVHRKVAELDRMIKQVNPEGIQRKLNDLKVIEERLGQDSRKVMEQLFYAYVPKLDKDLKQKLAEMDVASEKSLKETSGLAEKRSREMDALIAARSKEMDALIAARSKEIDALMKKVDIDSINSTMAELDIFKKQFIEVVSKNVSEFNAAKKSLAELMQQREKALDDGIKQIDGKIKELNDFERKFAEEMGLLIGEAAERQEEKTNKRKRK